jgi:hypothetical protein
MPAGQIGGPIHLTTRRKHEAGNSAGARVIVDFELAFLPATLWQLAISYRVEASSRRRLFPVPIRAAAQESRCPRLKNAILHAAIQVDAKHATAQHEADTINAALRESRDGFSIRAPGFGIVYTRS